MSRPQATFAVLDLLTAKMFEYEHFAITLLYFIESKASTSKDVGALESCMQPDINTWMFLKAPIAVTSKDEMTTPNGIIPVKNQSTSPQASN